MEQGNFVSTLGDFLPSGVPALTWLLYLLSSSRLFLIRQTGAAGRWSGASNEAIAWQRLIALVSNTRHSHFLTGDRVLQCELSSGATHPRYESWPHHEITV